ncbi:MAG TPA: hypothetical protein DCX65_03640 [Spirochaetaceae bacterium]|nr:hypothetical protein [Spirochaetaceae bacterium]HCQ87415.1 hypothetical protein [Spirochaetaceae bacterium]
MFGLSLAGCARFDINLAFQAVEMPTFADIQPGSYVEPGLVPTTVSLNLPVGALGLRYSLSPAGDTPTGWLDYTEPIALSDSITTVTAYAYTSQTNVSGYLTGTFVLQTAAVTADLAAGTYDTRLALSLACATPDAEIWYSLDGSVPAPGGAGSQRYSSPILQDDRLAVQARAWLSGREASIVFSADYDWVTAPASASLPTGVYASEQLLTLACATAGAAIWYTVDGLDPDRDADPPVGEPYDGSAVAYSWGEPGLRLRVRAYGPGCQPTAVVEYRYLWSNVFYVDGVNGDDNLNAGTAPGSPKKTIRAALALANAVGGTDPLAIRVAGPFSYVETEPLRILRPLTLSGSYDTAFSTQNTIANLTEIRYNTSDPGTTAVPAYTLLLNHVDGSSSLDSFRVYAPDGTTDIGVAAIVLDQTAVSFTTVRFSGLAAREISAGVAIRDSSPLFVDCTIEGGTGGSVTTGEYHGAYGAWISGPLANPEFRGGTISALGDLGAALGEPTRSAGLLFTEEARGLVGGVASNTVVQGGQAEVSVGILFGRGAAPQLLGNLTVTGCGATTPAFAAGLFIDGASPVAQGDNIVIRSGVTPSPAYGIYCIATDPLYPANPQIGDAGSTITVRTDGNGSGALAAGIWISGQYASGTIQACSITGRTAGAGPTYGIWIGDKARPQISRCDIASGDAGAFPAYGIHASNIEQAGLLIEQNRLRAGVSSVDACGLYLEDVMFAKVRRNRIYGSDAGVPSSGVDLVANTVGLDGVLLVANVIMGTNQPTSSGHFGVRHRVSGGVVSRPRFYNNTIVVDGLTSDAFLNLADGVAAQARPYLVNNILYGATSSVAFRESLASGGNSNPAALLTNSLFGMDSHYNDNTVPYTTAVTINSGILTGDGDCAGNVCLDVSAGFTGGALSIITIAFFFVYDWHLAGTPPDPLVMDGTNLRLLASSGLVSEDFYDFYGNSWPAAGLPWPIGATGP